MKSVVLASVLPAATGAAALAATFNATGSGTLGSSVNGFVIFTPPVTYEFDIDFTVDDAAGLFDSPFTGASGTLTTDRFGIYNVTGARRSSASALGEIVIEFSGDDFSNAPVGAILSFGIVTILSENPFTTSKPLVELLGTPSPITFVEAGRRNSNGSTTTIFDAGSATLTRVPDTAAVPLPAAGWALLTALGGLVMLRRRGAQRRPTA